MLFIERQTTTGTKLDHMITTEVKRMFAARAVGDTPLAASHEQRASHLIYRQLKTGLVAGQPPFRRGQNSR